MKRPSMECGIVLHPAGHTRSPAMHRAAHAFLGIDAAYEAHDVSPEGLADALAGFRARGLRQFAVSIPHKETIMPLLDEVDDVARRIGAVNTVTRMGDRLVGSNTDWLGGLRALEREIAIEGQRAVVLGAGGTARALTHGLRSRGCEVFVLNRTIERAERIVRELDATAAGPLEQLAELAPAILVNTTSVGMGEMRSPVPAHALPPGVVVLDAVYSPERTRLLLDAERRGGRTVGGKWMLVYQAVEQLRIWTAQLDAPPTESDLRAVTEVMARAFDEAGGLSGNASEA